MSNPSQTITHRRRPEILAPAGSQDAFLAALAAGADAVYCGLKRFSARMAAENFSVEELARLAELAHARQVRLYIALNTVIKPDELDAAGKLMDRLNRRVKPDAIIFQDLSVVQLARQIGFSGELHLSTLANVSFPEALKTVRQIEGVDRVVIPRELHVDEIRSMAAACPAGIDLEAFVHGALCYGVSGRCYWSSYMGGKSGLRGRCVQPCRRIYSQKGRKKRFFSCSDLSLDVLAKVLLSEKNISAWKIEGRRKGPHYVYHTVSAYRLFRDHGSEPERKKEALYLLETALGRKGTHYHFLPQRPQVPIETDIQTGSGRMVGRVKGPVRNPYLVPNMELVTGDLLRVGYEDEPWHHTLRVTRNVPKKGRLVLHKGNPRSGTPVFLLDRRDPGLSAALQELSEKLAKIPAGNVPPSSFQPVITRGKKRSAREMGHGTDMLLSRKPVKGRRNQSLGFWLSADTVSRLTRPAAASAWCWIPPVIWPEDEPVNRDLIQQAYRRGCRHFVCNAPWQISLVNFSGEAVVWAGPFCNITNAAAIRTLADLGFSGVIVSPELGQKEYQAISRKPLLPLGIVISGNWPLCVSRTVSPDVRLGAKLVSPKKEEAWVARYDALYWLFPNWKVDLLSRKEMLQKSGFTLFVTIDEIIPAKIEMKKRPGLWNWRLGLPAWWPAGMLVSEAISLFTTFL